MLTQTFKTELGGSRGDHIVLLIASFASVAVVTAAVRADGTATGLESALHLIVAGIGAVLALGIALVARGKRAVGPSALPLPSPGLREHRRLLAAAGAIVSTEPQTLLVWERDAPLSVAVHALSNVPGVPAGEAELLCFGHWLETGSAEAVRGAVEKLFREGHAFSLVAKTVLGNHLEVDGYAVGGRGVVRLRDMTGYRRELLGILERHERLSREVGASRALLDELSMPVWFRENSGKLLWVNAAYAAAVEAAGSKEVIERQIELLEPRQRQSVSRALGRGQPYRKRIHLGAGGERRARELVILPLDEGSAAAALEVSAAETAKDDRDWKIQAFDRTLDRVATAVAIFSQDQQLTFYNEAYLKLWQLDSAWLDTKPADGAVLDRLRELGRLPEVVDYRAWKAQILACYETGLEPDTRWHLPDGRLLHVIAELRPDGGVTYLYVDETEKIGLESRFNALIGVQRETLNSLKEGVAVFATDGKLQLFNSAFAAIWNLSTRVLENSPHIDEIVALAKPLYDGPAIWEQISRTVTGFSDERGQAEGQMLRTDMTVVDYTATPLPDGATLLTFADVTGAKRYERALVERNEALVKADQLKNQFIGHVSYELRTPLTNIIGFSELLTSPRTGPMNEKQYEYLSDIASSSKTLLAIIDDILDLTSIDAGALELKLARVDVRSVIDAAIKGIRDRAARARLTLDIGIADDIDDFVADEARIRQVLYNLLSNAVSFSPSGRVVQLTAVREERHIVFSVEDEGVGIPKEQQARVFDRFEGRKQGSRPRGPGLGLAIAKSLVELHGGSMTLTSEPGRGTCVSVLLPENAPAPANSASPRRSRPVRLRASKSAFGASPR